MVDVTGKEIKPEMCVELEYYSGTAIGAIGIFVCKYHGKLG